MSESPGSATRGRGTLVIHIDWCIIQELAMYRVTTIQGGHCTSFYCVIFHCLFFRAEGQTGGTALTQTLIEGQSGRWVLTQTLGQRVKVGEWH